MEIGERIRARREELGMSQDELAKRCGYASRVSISKIESDSRGLPTDKVATIARALRVSPAYLMGWEDADGNEIRDEYYLDPEVTQMAQELASRPEMQIMFDASRNLTKEDIEVITALIEKMSKN